MPDPTAIEATEPIPPAEPSLLTVCLPAEPSSLFLYGDSSQSARNVRQAIYDGPLDIVDYEAVPVLLEELPKVDNGGVKFEPISVQPGEILVDFKRHAGKFVRRYFLPARRVS